MGEVKAIETEADCDQAWERFWQLINADAGTPEAQELQQLMKLIEQYEARDG